MNWTKPIVLTTHAAQRMNEREIDVETYEEFIKKARISFKPDGSIKAEYRKNIFILLEQEKIIKVLTAYKKNLPLEKMIEKLPPDGNGFWKQEAKDMFLEQAYFLLSKGLTEDEIVEHLTNVYVATTKEYGE